jgi:hypothetical protein
MPLGVATNATADAGSVATVRGALGAVSPSPLQATATTATEIVATSDTCEGIDVT